jgi:two-component sensor histidine kinase
VDDSIKMKMDADLGHDLEYMYEKKRNDALLLSKDIQIRKVKKKNDTVFYVLLSSALFLVIIILFVYRAYKEQNKMNKLLINQQKTILEKNKQVDGALQEKIYLLREIHHRVKNNLQIISSLLNLQSSTIEDPSVLKALEESKERIQAIALIHQKLYQNDSFASIIMKGYLEDLAQQLQRSYVAPDKVIQFHVISDDFSLNLDTAVPVGLICCELITNAYKHAFTERSSGNVYISIEKIVHDIFDFKLVIRDDGSWIGTNKVKSKNGSLGEGIVESLTEQLEGTIEKSSSHEGTVVQIFFKEVKG